MQKQKGISTLAGVIIIVAVVVVLFGGVFAYQYFAKSQTPVTNDQQNFNVQTQQPTNQEINNTGAIEQEQQLTKEQSCVASGGKVELITCYCSDVPDFINDCNMKVSTCNCDPALGINRQIKMCVCDAGKCFDGTSCIDS